MDSRSRILVIGDTFIDMVCEVPRVPVSGEAAWGSQLVSTGGGSGGNMAATLANFGVDVAFVTSVGDDANGRGAIEEYQSLGIDVSGVAVLDSVATSVCVIMLDDALERTILVCADGAASDQLRRDDISNLDFSTFEHVLISGLAMANNPTGDTYVSLAKELPPDAVVYFDPNLRVQPEKLTDEIRGRYLALATRADVILAGADEIAVLGLARNPGQVLIRKLGVRGADVETDVGTFHVSPLSARVVNATGAGDAFAAAFVAARAKGESLARSTQLAAASGALAVAAPGSRGHFDWNAVEAAADAKESR